jgi:IclR family transcriptional regulator, KDG regulon repressor
MTTPNANADAAASKSGPRTTRTLMRGLAVLESLSEADRGLGPSEIAGRVDLDKGTVSRLLQTLIEAGYVRRDPQARTYALSSKILRLSQGLRQHLDLRSISHPHLSRLCQEVQETVHLGVRDEGQVVYVDKVEPQEQAIRLVSAIGRTMPLRTTALGKAMLAGYSPAVFQEVLALIDFPKGTTRAIKDKEEFEQEIEVTRRRGFAIDLRENEADIICVGAAIVGEGQTVIGAISITSPSFRVENRILDFGAKCRDAAAAISHDAGAEGLML